MLPVLRIVFSGSELRPDPWVPTSLPQPRLGNISLVTFLFSQSFLQKHFPSRPRLGHQPSILIFLKALSFAWHLLASKCAFKLMNFFPGVLNVGVWFCMFKWRVRFRQQAWTGHQSLPTSPLSSPLSPSSIPPSDGESDAGGKLRLDKRDHPRIGAFRTWRATCQVGSGKIICRKISENISEGGTWTTWEKIPTMSASFRLLLL